MNTVPTIALPVTLSFTAKVDYATGLLLSGADGNADWNGGSLKAQITALAEAADCLHLPSTNPGASVTNDTAWTLSFNASATNGTINANYYDKKIVCSRRYNGGHMAKRLISTIAITLGMLAATAVVAGGAYTKIANNGAALPDSATLGSGPNDWACSRDNAIGLLWEVGGWRDQSQKYTNYDNNWGQSLINNSTNSIGLANAANAVNLCGYADWRRPSKNDLWNLMWWGKTPAPLIDQTYFPDTPIEYYWSSDLSPSGWLYNGLVVTTADGSISEWLNRDSPRRVRLVRSAQFITHSVSLTGSGAGRVVADGIDCTRMTGVNDGICSNASAWKDAPVTLTATSFPGSTFSAWGGACSGSASSCTLTLTANTTVTAAFSVPVATRSIVIDPATPANVYAALDGSGVYRSPDSGANWTAATTQPANLNVRALVIKPGSPATLFAASYGGGVFKSTDSAATWATCTTQPSNLNLQSLAIDGNGKLYAGSEAGVFVSINDCAAWTAMNTGLPN